MPGLMWLTFTEEEVQKLQNAQLRDGDHSSILLGRLLVNINPRTRQMAITHRMLARAFKRATEAGPHADLFTIIVLAADRATGGRFRP